MTYFFLVTFFMPISLVTEQVFSSSCTSERLCSLPTSYILSTLSTSISNQCESLPNCIGGVISISRLKECDDGSAQHSISVESNGSLSTVSVVYGQDDTFIDVPIGHGSITKTLTSAAILRLQELGLLDIDDFIVDYLPNDFINIWNSLWNTTEWQIATIRDLLAHTSGFPEFVDLARIHEFVTQDWKDFVTPYDCITTEMPDYAQLVGYGNFSYSNTNYELLGIICEQVTGMNWTDCINTYAKTGDFDLLLPEMYYVERNVQVWPGYVTFPDPPFNWSDPTNVTKHFALGYAGPAGALFSKSKDLARWIHTLFGTTDILSQESIDLMIPNYNSTLVKEFKGWDIYKLGCDVDTPALIRNGTKYLAYGHEGDTIGYNSAARYIPQLDIAIVGTDNNWDPFNYPYTTFGVNQTLLDLLVACEEYVDSDTSSFTSTKIMSNTNETSNGSGNNNHGNAFDLSSQVLLFGICLFIIVWIVSFGALRYIENKKAKEAAEAETQDDNIRTGLLDSEKKQQTQQTKIQMFQS